MGHVSEPAKADLVPRVCFACGVMLVLPGFSFQLALRIVFRRMTGSKYPHSETGPLAVL